jgi:hypothetical protein
MNDHNTNKSLTKVTSQEQSLSLTKSQANLAIWTRNSLEKEVVLAAYDKQLSNYSTAEDITKLIAMVTKWRIMLGLSKEMSEEELKINVQFIKTNYQKFTLKDIDIAINWSLQGKLGVNVEPYGTFSPLYISRILNAYGSKAEDMINDIMQRRKLEARLQAAEKIVLTYEETITQRRNYIVWFIDKIKTENKYLGDFDNIMWDFLTKYNLIKVDEKWTEQASEFADGEILRENMDEGYAKFYDKLQFNDKKVEMKKRREMYGRYYLLKKFCQTITNPEEWILGYEDKMLIAPPKNK